MPTMETFNFFKLWKTSPGNVIPPPEYDDEDSFFDLELNYETKYNNIPKLPITNTFESDEDDESFENSPKSFDSRSPISFLKSPPKLPLFFQFRKTKITGDESPAPASPVLSRSNSSSSRKSQGPKEVVCKYLRLMKVRVSGERIFSPKVAEGMRSTSLRIVSKRLGKSRSTVPAARVWSSGGDSVLQSDGIQSAILHCKRSYNSSIDLSVLSRSVSEPVVSANPSRFSIEEKKRISI